MLFVLIDSTQIACTCTLLWLIQYSEVYRKYDAGNYEIVAKENSSVCLHEITCNFTEHQSKCSDKNVAHLMSTTDFKQSMGFFEQTNFFYSIKWLQFIVEICLQPFFCLLSILTNTLILISLSSQTGILKKNLSNCIYNHIKANSMFNIVFALIRLASLLNICVFPRSSYCSSIYKHAESQYFKIYLVYFFGNTVRLCGNMSYICFSASRYFVSTSKPSKVFDAFTKLNLKRFYSSVMLACLAFSLFRVFQF